MTRSFSDFLNKHLFLIGILFLFCSNNSFSQLPSKVRIELDALPFCETDSCRAAKYYFAAKYYLRINNDSLLIYTDKSKEIASKNNLYDRLYSSYLVEKSFFSKRRDFEKLDTLEQMILGLMPLVSDDLKVFYFSSKATKFQRIAVPDSALFYHEKVLDMLHRNMKDYGSIMVRTHINIGYSKKNLGLYEESIAHLKLALDSTILLEKGADKMIVDIYDALAFIFKRIGDYEGALKYSYAGLKILKKDIKTLNTFRYNLANCYAAIENKDSLTRYVEILSNEPRKNLQNTTACLLNGLKSERFLTNNQVDSAIFYTQKELKCIDVLKYGSKKNILLRLGRIETIVGNHELAFDYFKKVYFIYKKDKNIDFRKRAEFLKYLVQSAVRINAPEKNSFLQEFIFARDTLQKIMTDRAITNSSAGMKTLLKEKENEILEAKSLTQKAIISQKNFMMNVLLIGIGGLLLFFGLLWRQKKKTDSANFELKQKNEKIEILNKDINHRVKNDLQLISSIFEMETRRAPDEVSKQFLQGTDQRIQTMTTLYRRLYSENQTQVNIEEYLNEIVGKIRPMFKDIRLEARIESSDEFTSEKALWIGLILNELITNAKKHAFEGVLDPKVEINFNNNSSESILEIRDNGLGLKNEYSKEAKRTTGSLLIHSFVNRLHAKMLIDTSNGMRYTFLIPK